jgi:hypothetical protein
LGKVKGSGKIKAVMLAILCVSVVLFGVTPMVKASASIQLFNGNTGSPGDLIFLTATGFSPSTTATAYFGYVFLQSVTTDTNGDVFSGMPMLLNVPQVANGQYLIKVIDSLGNTGSVQYTVKGSTVTPTIQPKPSPTITPHPLYTDSPTPSPSPTPIPTSKLTKLTITVDASSTAVGAPVNIKGQLLDGFGSPIVDKTVSVTYMTTGSTSWVLIGSGTTDATGEYSAQWVNAALGMFLVEAVFNGESDHFASITVATINFLPSDGKNVFLVKSTSTVTDLVFNSTTNSLSFAVNTPSGTGQAEIVVAKPLVSSGNNVQVYVDGNTVSPTITSNDNSWLLSFTYPYSSHDVKLVFGPSQSTPFWGTFTSLTVIGIAIAIILLSVIWTLTKRKNKTTSKKMVAPEGSLN